MNERTEHVDRRLDDAAAEIPDLVEFWRPMVHKLVEKFPVKFGIFWDDDLIEVRFFDGDIVADFALTNRREFQGWLVEYYAYNRSTEKVVGEQDFYYNP